MKITLPAAWRKKLAGEFKKPYFQKLQDFVDRERETHTVFPPEIEVFNAFQHTPYDNVKVMLLGQDPYHGEGQAHGLCFSVRPGVRPPPSLRNIFKELKSDIGCPLPNHGCLTSWADRGVFLLNAVLTVRANKPASHKRKGWEVFTDEVIRLVGEKQDRVVFLLWGRYARDKIKLIDAARHTVLTAPHPSPLSAKTGFFGSRPFSQANHALRAAGREEIDWCLPERPAG
ncbi:MAG: uracil-DNA glycosylase [Planctomycetes bacterium]|nr:uracil-DNA glycosylase [Planctomycetota bacterium]